MQNIRILFVFCLFLSCLLSSCSSGGNNSTTNGLMCPVFESGTLCTSVKPFCGNNCSNTPFCPTTCWPTSEGSAWSGAGSESESTQLYCANNTYANCHYSGAPYPTGNSESNPALPCKINDDGVTSTCRCPVFHGVNYVNIDAIMNLGVYYETIEVCGIDGSKCQNMSSCPGPNCAGKVPPVCKYLKAQNPNDPENSFIPGADVISTFGNAMTNSGAYTAGSTSCSNIKAAGCMTQPCKYEEGSNKKFALCQCPVNPPGNVDLHQSGLQCNLESGYVWE